MSPRPLRLIAFPLCLLMVPACSTLQPERSIGRQFDDTNASLSIKSAMLRSEGFALDGVDVEVTEGIALLTGHVPRERDKRMAECLTWSSVAVRNVANELVVGPAPDARTIARDSTITGRVNAALIADRDVRSINFNVETHQGRVYLLGVARNRAELERASAHAALVDGVTDVVSFVRIAGVPSDLPSRGERRADACEGEARPAVGNADPDPAPELLGGPGGR